MARVITNVESTSSYPKVTLENGDTLYLVGSAQGSIRVSGDIIIIPTIIDDSGIVNFTVNYTESNLDKHGTTTPDGLVEYWGANNFFFDVGGGGGTGGSVVAIDANHIFTDNAARDTYFDSPDPHLDELTANATLIFITSTDEIQTWTGTTNPASYVNTNWDPSPLSAQADFDETNSGARGFIRNKPTDLTDLSTHASTELSDITSSGSGSIITSAERTKLSEITDTGRGQIITSDEADDIQDSINDLSISGQVITFTKNDGTEGTIRITSQTGTIQPPPVLPSGTLLSLQSTNFDISSGSFPSGASAGFVYTVTPGATEATIDGILFDEHDAILALVASPSTTTYAGNWHKIEGDDGVHSWGGLTGIIDDSEILRVLTRIGIPTTVVLSDLVLNDIGNRIQTADSLVGDHSISFSISNPTLLRNLNLEIENNEVHPFTLTSLHQGSNTITVNISSGEWNTIISENPTSLAFRLQGTLLSGGTITSNTVTVIRAAAQDHEQTHFGFVSSTEDQTDIVFSNNDIEARDQADGNWTVSGIPTDSTLHRLYFAVPTAQGSITSVSQSAFNITNQFTSISSVTISGQTYNILLMNVGSAVNSNYNGTILNVS